MYYRNFNLWVARGCGIAFLCLTILGSPWVVPAIAQAIGSTPISTTMVDLSPTVTLVLGLASVIVLTAGMWFINSHVKDDKTRAALTSILEKGVSLGYNTVQGALKDKVLSVDVGSQVAATALKYAQQFGPAAAAHFGLNDEALVKMIWARLPAVDGAVTEQTFSDIAATASGHAPLGTLTVNDIPSIIESVVAALQNKGSAGTTSAPKT